MSGRFNFRPTFTVRTLPHRLGGMSWDPPENFRFPEPQLNPDQQALWDQLEGMDCLCFTLRSAGQDDAADAVAELAINALWRAAYGGDE